MSKVDLSLHVAFVEISANGRSQLIEEARQARVANAHLYGQTVAEQTDAASIQKSLRLDELARTCTKPVTDGLKLRL